MSILSKGDKVFFKSSDKDHKDGEAVIVKRGKNAGKVYEDEASVDNMYEIQMLESGEIVEAFFDELKKIE